MGLSPRRHPRQWVALLGLVVALGMGGCGEPSPGNVSGKITYKGALLKGGTITFSHVDKQKTYLSEIGEDGSYTIRDVPIGQVQVTVETESLKERARVRINPVPADAQGNPNPKPGDPKDLLNRYVQIPKKYSNPGESGLEYTVKSGSQDFPIDLK